MSLNLEDMEPGLRAHLIEMRAEWIPVQLRHAAGHLARARTYAADARMAYLEAVIGEALGWVTDALAELETPAPIPAASPDQLQLELADCA